MGQTSLPATLTARTKTQRRVSRVRFESSSETDGLAMSLSQAIGVLRDHGIDPDDHLDTTAVEDFASGVQIPTTFSR